MVSMAKLNIVALPLLALTVGGVSAQQPGPTATPLQGALHITADGSGGVYSTIFRDGAPSIVHLNAAGAMHTLVREHDVEEKDEHGHTHVEEGEFLLLHMPSEAWLTGDGTTLMFPVFRHVHPWHVAEIMMLQNGKVSRLLSIDQKMRYSLQGQTLDRHMISARRAAIGDGQIHVYAFLSEYPMHVLGEHQVGHLSPVSFRYRSTALGAGANETTPVFDLDSEDPQYSVVEPGCVSRSGAVFALGIPPVSFFGQTWFKIETQGSEGVRRTLASRALLGENAFACTGDEGSVFYREENGRLKGVSVRAGGVAQTIFDGQTVAGHAAGEVTQHQLTASGVHYFAMKVGGGEQGVFSVDAQGRAATVLAPGFAGAGRVIKGMAVSGGTLYLLTDVATVQIPATQAQVLAWKLGGGGPGVGMRVVNAASMEESLSPGAWGSIFGQGFAGATVVAQGLPIPTELGGVRVLLDGNAAPVSMVSPGQINFQAPWELGAPAAVEVRVVRQDAPIEVVKVGIEETSPAIFRAGGAYVVTTADYRLVDEGNPCKAGSVCIIWANGMGKANRAVAAGGASPPMAEALAQPSLQVNNRPAQILFAGLSPGLVGVWQINFVMSAAVGDGPSPAMATGLLKQGARELSFQFRAQE